jgi:hypothetical protein
MVHTIQKVQTSGIKHGIHRSTVVTVMGTPISFDIEERPLTKENLLYVANKVLEKKSEISNAVGQNWYPCGGAHLIVAGNSPLIKLIKKEGVSDHDDYYRLGNISAMKTDRGYWVSLRYEGANATEDQSLNFIEPLHKLFQFGLEALGVESYVDTYID